MYPVNRPKIAAAFAMRRGPVQVDNEMEALLLENRVVGLERYSNRQFRSDDGVVRQFDSQPLRAGRWNAQHQPKHDAEST
jgi:hypothetical protein